VVYPALGGRATRGPGRRFDRPAAPSGTRGNLVEPLPLFSRQWLEVHMLRGGLLWLIGIPLPIILLLFFFGFLH
jgi:hypothetical protein